MGIDDKDGNCIFDDSRDTHVPTLASRVSYADRFGMTVVLSTLVAFTLAICGLLACLPADKASPPRAAALEDYVDQVFRASVKVESEGLDGRGSWGTGTVISGLGKRGTLVLTCGHVPGEVGSEVKIIPHHSNTSVDRRPYKGKVLIRIEKAESGDDQDVSIIAPDEGYLLDQLPWIPAETWKLKPGQRFLTAGRVDIMDIGLTFGLYQGTSYHRVESRWLMVQCGLAPGSSGSSFWCVQEGQLRCVGILCRGPHHMASATRYIQPVERLLHHLNPLEF